jgi:hypothetical protein
MNGMFNWAQQHPQPGEQTDPIVSKNFWIYLAITIPLTALILGGWLIFYFVFQKPQTTRDVKRIIDDLEDQLPPIPPRIPLFFKGEKSL